MGPDYAYEVARIIADVLAGLDFVCGDGFAYTVSLYVEDALENAGYNVVSVKARVDEIYLTGQLEMTITVRLDAGGSGAVLRYAANVFFTPLIATWRCGKIRKDKCLYQSPARDYYDGSCDDARIGVLDCKVYWLETNGQDVTGDAYLFVLGRKPDGSECRFEADMRGIKVLLRVHTAYVYPY